MRTPSENEVRKLVREAVERALGPSGAPAPAAKREPTPVSPRRVAIGSDHGGFALKEILRKAIADEMGWQVHDCGTHSEDAVDYPDFAAAVARAILAGRAARGVIVCGSGVGASVAANKFPGIRSALCDDTFSAHQGVEDDSMNVLAGGVLRRRASPPQTSENCRYREGTNVSMRHAGSLPPIVARRPIDAGSPR
jgi:RpiB/LacA/LacB family sugar-phosphate isomerase